MAMQPAMARVGIRLILEHFGAPADYTTVNALYLNLCDMIVERSVLGERVHVNEVIERAFQKAWEELHPAQPYDVEDE